MDFVALSMFSFFWFKEQNLNGAWIIIAIIFGCYCLLAFFPESLDSFLLESRTKDISSGKWCCIDLFL